MNREAFQSIIESEYTPGLSKLGFGAPTFQFLGGRMYMASFIAPECMVVVTYEPGEEYVTGWVHRPIPGGWSAVDDRVNTLRFEDIRARLGTSPHFDSKRESRADQSDAASRQLGRYAQSLERALAQFMRNEQT